MSAIRRARGDDLARRHVDPDMEDPLDLIGRLPGGITGDRRGDPDPLRDRCTGHADHQGQDQDCCTHKERAANLPHATATHVAAASSPLASGPITP